MKRLVSALVIVLPTSACSSQTEQGSASSATDAEGSTGSDPRGSSVGVSEGQESPLSIDPTAAGWNDGDSGDLYRQGDYMMASFLECNDDDVHVGDFVPCSTAEATNGVVTSSPIDRLTWIGLSKGGS
jgi:hypothetical protein